MPTYDITIDSPSTGNTVSSPFTATGTVSSDDGSAFNYTVECSLTSFMTGEKRVMLRGIGPSTWSLPVTGGPGTYSLDAKLYIDPTTNPPTGVANATDSVSNLIISATPAPIGIISIDDPLPDPPAPAPAAAKSPHTRAITVVGSYDPNSEAARITCVVTAEQDNNTKGSKHHYVVSALTFPASDFKVTMDAPHRRRYAVHAMAFRADGTLLATSTMHHPKKR